MPGKPAITEALNQSFITALLLCGDKHRAETAMMESIQNLCLNGGSAQALLRGAVIAALPTSGPREAIDSSILPLELQRVMCLAPVPRRCYVLRVLLAWSREDCASLLHMDSAQVDDEACFAAQALARMAYQIAIPFSATLGHSKEVVPSSSDWVFAKA